MTIKPSQPPKRRPAKLDSSGKFLIGALSLTAFVGGWGLVAQKETKPASIAAEPAFTATPRPAAIMLTATPWPAIVPLPTLPPIPTVAPLNPNRFVGGGTAGQPAIAPVAANIAPPMQLAPVPTLAPLPAMPAPPPPPPSGGGGGGGNATTGS